MNASRKAASISARAQWLSELNRAIDEAQWLAWRIGAVEGRNALALDLYVRLEMVRSEVEAMRPRSFVRLGSNPGGDFPAAGEWLEK